MRVNVFMITRIGIFLLAYVILRFTFTMEEIPSRCWQLHAVLTDVLPQRTVL